LPPLQAHRLCTCMLDTYWVPAWQQQDMPCHTPLKHQPSAPSPPSANATSREGLGLPAAGDGFLAAAAAGFFAGAAFFGLASMMASSESLSATAQGRQERGWGHRATLPWHTPRQLQLSMAVWLERERTQRSNGKQRHAHPRLQQDNTTASLCCTSPPGCFLAAGFLAAGFLAAGLNCASSSSLQQAGRQAGRG